MKATIRITRKFLSFAIKAHLTSLRKAVDKAETEATIAKDHEEYVVHALKIAECQTDAAINHAIAVKAGAKAEAATFNERI